MTDAPHDLSFEALELQADGGFAPVALRFAGCAADGWRIERNGAEWLRLGPGYEPLETVACGVCSTDLDRIHLPFRLPQVVGHEMVACDSHGRRFVVEINASPAARGAPRPGCSDCTTDLHRHCRERLVVGIHDLPGGFGPRFLAPRHALVPVPDDLPTATAALVEPFAAALRAVERTVLRPGDRIAVLGPRRLGTLLVAALASATHRRELSCTITAIIRRTALADLQLRVGADRVEVVDGDEGAPLPDASFDVVFDTTGSPAGLATALRLARREVHLKSTHGRPAAGLGDPTAFVVDELSIARLEPGAVRPRGRVVWLSSAEPPVDWKLEAGVERYPSPQAACDADVGAAGNGCVVGAHTVVVDRFDEVDAVIRPFAGEPRAAVRPTGQILVRERGAADSALAIAVSERGLRLSSSRCGDFVRALDLLQADPLLRDLGEVMIDRRYPADQLAAAFDAARGRDVVKVLVEHPG